jgi:hypothetical protein
VGREENDTRISKVPASCAYLTRFFSLAQSPVLVNSSEVMISSGATICSVQGSIPVEKYIRGRCECGR